MSYGNKGLRREKWIRILFPPHDNVLLTISDRRMVNDFDYVYDPTLTGNNYIQNGAAGANGFINPAGGPPGAGYDYLTMPGMGQNTTCLAVITTAQDYYPFGSMMPGRQVSSDGYRYGFNGKEKDDEVSGTGNQYDYGFRIYNPGLGRFLSIDPLTRKFPFLSTYQFASNTPIMASDLDGLEANIEIVPDIDGKPALELVLYIQVENLSSYTAKDIQNYTAHIINQIEESFKGTVKYKGVELKFSADVYVTSGDKKFSLTFKNVGIKNGGDYEPRDRVLGEADDIGYTQQNNADIYLGKDQDDPQQVGLTGAHEKGHELGLLHINRIFFKQKKNLMWPFSDGSGTQDQLKSSQLKTIMKNVLWQQEDKSVRKELRKAVREFKKNERKKDKSN